MDYVGTTSRKGGKCLLPTEMVYSVTHVRASLRVPIMIEQEAAMPLSPTLDPPDDLTIHSQMEHFPLFTRKW